MSKRNYNQLDSFEIIQFDKFFEKIKMANKTKMNLQTNSISLQDENDYEHKIEIEM